MSVSVSLRSSAEISSPSRWILLQLLVNASFNMRLILGKKMYERSLETSSYKESMRRHLEYLEGKTQGGQRYQVERCLAGWVAGRELSLDREINVDEDPLQGTQGDIYHLQFKRNLNTGEKLAYRRKWKLLV